MSVYETSITNPKKQVEFYKDLSEQLESENKELKKQLKIKQDGFMASVEESCELAEENQKYKEVIDKAKKLHNEFASKNSLLVFENNNLIDFMNNLISVLKEVEDK